jgi:hypothetical protein
MISQIRPCRKTEILEHIKPINTMRAPCLGNWERDRPGRRAARLAPLLIPITPLEINGTDCTGTLEKTADCSVESGLPGQGQSNWVKVRQTSQGTV